MTLSPIRRATLQDVAREAGVSSITAWRALNQPHVVAEGTVAKVHEAVETLGYVPNAAARGLPSGRSRTVAALVPSVSNWMFADAIQGLSDALHAAGYQLLLGCSGYDQAVEEQALRAIVDRQPDGIVVTGRGHSPAARSLLKRAAAPVVEIWDHGSSSLDMSVGFSNREIGAEVVRFLVAKGHRRLGFVGVAGRARGRQRLAGFRAALAALDLDAAEVPTAEVEDSLAGGASGLVAMLEARPAPGAVFFNGDLLASGALLECQRRGVPVPDELALVGLGDLDLAAHLSPKLTTVRVPRYAVGEHAARMLLGRLDADVMPRPRRMDLGFEIVEREST